MLLQGNILESRIQVTEESLVLIRATIQGESLKRGHVGRRLKVFTLSETTKAEVYNSIRHPINSESVPQTKVAENNSRHEQVLGSLGGPSKVTADTGKVAAPLEEEASSLHFAKVRPSPKERPQKS